MTIQNGYPVFVPKVTESYRRARRDEIAAAAMRVLRVKGVAGTSVADIVRESGLSAGAIYSNFTNKAELAAYVADHVTSWKLDELNALAADGAAHPPSAIMATVLNSAVNESAPFDLVVQFWGEAVPDDTLHARVVDTIDELRGGFQRAVHAWATAERPDDPGFAGRLAAAMVAVCQGYILTAALRGEHGTAGYIDAVTALR